jgi:hypothetical protein
MSNLLGNQNNLPDCLKNPFSTESIVSVSMLGYKSSFGNEFRYSGWVEFKNGNTYGKQEFKASSFGELYMMIYKFCEQLETKRY